MMTGLKLPEQVKGVVSDCAFTSPKEVSTHAVHSMYHLPAFPLIPLADRINRKKAGYGLGRLQRGQRSPEGSCSGADDPRGQRYFRSLLDVRCNL